MSNMLQPNKSVILQAVTELSKAGLITELELSQAFHQDQAKPQAPLKTGFSLNYAKVLGFLGSFIIFLGIGFITSTLWPSMNDITQILVTLGVGVLAYLIGNLLMYSLEQKYIGGGVHLIGGLMIPIGAMVTVSKIYPSDVDVKFICLLFALIFGGLFLIYAITDRLLKSNVFTVFASIFGTAAFWLGYIWILWGDQFDYITFYWGWLVVSISYILISYALKNTFQSPTGNLLHWLGVFGILSSTAGLAIDNVILEIGYTLLLSACFYLSARLQSRMYLIQGLLFTVGYIFYINGRYFIEVIGWPIALILCGLTLILVSYFGVEWNKKFLKRSNF